MRDLATIVTIKSTERIEGYDRIQLAWFEENAYQAIVPIEVKQGDLVCWIEADSLLPDIPRYEWLRKRCFVPSLGKLRIRVMKMAGYKSWGLVIPLNELPPRKRWYKKGEDVTDFLGITKYEPAEDASPTKKQSIFNVLYKSVPILRPMLLLIKWIIRKFKHNTYEDFPSNLIAKTDETSIQNTPNKLERYKNIEIYVTAKMEGQSATYFLDKHNELRCCSRNCMYLGYSDNNYCNYAKDNDVKDILLQLRQYYNLDLIIQGELVGPGIQKNIYKFDKLRMYVFNMYDQKNKRYLDWLEMKDVVAHVGYMGLELVPELDAYTYRRLEDVMPDVESAERIARDQYFITDGIDVQNIEMSDPNSLSTKKLWKDFYQHEGIVVRGMKNEFSFKVKNIDYADWFSGRKD